MEKLYYAKHHVRIKGYTLRPGEVFESALDEKTAQRLLRIGAIAEAEIDPRQAIELDMEAEPEEASEAPEDVVSEPETIAQEQQNAPENDKDEMAVPEIDVTEGISAGSTKTKRRKKAT